MSKMTQKDKIDYLYQLVLEDPDIIISKVVRKFPDGTFIPYFWNNINQEVKMNRHKKILTEEQKSIFHTVALIDNMQKRYYKMSAKEKADYLEKYVQEDPSRAIYTHEKFPDGSLFVSFLNQLNCLINTTKTSKHLTKREEYMIQTIASIENMRGSYQKMTQKEKMDYVIDLVKEDPDILLYRTDKKFPDHTLIKDFWVYTNVKIRKKCDAKRLTKEEKYLFYGAALIDNMQRKYAKMTPSDKINHLYEYVKRNPAIQLSSTKETFPDGTHMAHYWNNLTHWIVTNNDWENVSEQEKYIIHTAALIDDLQRKYKKMDTMTKADYLLKLMSQNQDFFLDMLGEKFPDGTKLIHFWNNTRNLVHKKRNAQELSQKESYLIHTMALIDQMRYEDQVRKRTLNKKV